MNRKAQRGLTLIELMVVLVILGIIISIGYPGYTGQMRKSRRAAAVSTIQDAALAQEQFRANNPTYGTVAEIGLAVSDDYYTYTTSNISATTFTITATATVGGAQTADTGCTALTINESNVRGPAACF